MKRDKETELVFSQAVATAFQKRMEFLTPELVLLFISENETFRKVLASYQCDPIKFREEINDLLIMQDNIPEEVGEYELIASEQMAEVIAISEIGAKNAGRRLISIPHVVAAILNLEESYARFVLLKNLSQDTTELMATVIAAFNGEELPTHAPNEELYEDSEDEYVDMPVFISGNEPNQEKSWKKLVTCITELAKNHNPLIGREEELERTIQVLCRKEKNNPLHVGESGVGKTALVYGLAQRIADGQVPERLAGAKIYQMDMGSMVAGTSYRGDFEKRMKAVMEGVAAEGNSIVYIDEIHTLIGSGTGGDSSLDGSNMLKPYLERGEIRFIGSTTYQEYNRYFQKNKGLVRRFQQIDIAEPSIEQTIGILEGLKDKYEKYHGVTYADGVIQYAAEASAKHISDRFLPDKAIDLLDEAGAYRETHPLMRKYRNELRRSGKQTVDKELINEVLGRICKIDPKQLQDQDTQNLETLSQRILSQIYGQDIAVNSIVEAVQMGKAGLLDDEKPIASLLFVGPTGVGKTEVCKVLAQELGIELVRFDMSEYTEKHTVAKLIGSPAGYVGYEDGGLLTDAIRKTPNCVLLLDEIEKAHEDIYNILLQVMDYAKLTDNKGQKADFRHVILVMTSNAGAQYAHQSSVGFGSSVSAGEAMLSAVKKTFKPEFLARLSGTVTFNDMDRTMAQLILDKKLRQLESRLAKKNVTLNLSESAHELLLSKGYSKQKGAREMDFVMNKLLNPVLMREILFGKLKKGGIANIDVASNELIIK